MAFAGGLPTSGNDLHIFAVYNQISTATQVLLGSSAPQFYHAAPRVGGALVGGFDGTAFRAAGAVQTGSQLIEWVWNASTLTFETFRNGVSLGTDAYDGTNGTGGNVTLGAGDSGTTGFCDLILSEFVVLDILPQGSGLANIRSKLIGKYL
jgi:hypothetical protein